VRQYPAIEADLHGVGARTLGRVDDPLGDLVWITPWHLFGLPLDNGHRQTAKILAGKLCSAQIFGADIIGRPGGRIAGLTQPIGLGEVAVAKQGPVEIKMVWSHLAHRLPLAVGDIGTNTEREMVGGYPVARLREAMRVVTDDVVAQALRAS
jgi:hypothetical protein